MIMHKKRSRGFIWHSRTMPISFDIQSPEESPLGRLVLGKICILIQTIMVLWLAFPVKDSLWDGYPEVAVDLLGISGKWRITIRTKLRRGTPSASWDFDCERRGRVGSDLEGPDSDFEVSNTRNLGISGIPSVGNFGI